MMDKMMNPVSFAVGIAGGVCAWLWGGWDKLFGALVSLIVLDYITGVLKAVYQKRLSSEIGFKGIIKKILILITVAAANIVQTVIGSGSAIREIVLMFFISNEGISLLENCADVCGTKIPAVLRNTLLQLRCKGGEEDELCIENQNSK